MGREGERKKERKLYKISCKRNEFRENKKGTYRPVEQTAEIE